MNLSEIIAVSGINGLYKTIAQTKNGIIAESLADKKRIPVYAAQKVHTLEAISVYCKDNELPLAEVFKKISEKQNKGPAIDHKSDEAELTGFFATVLPDYDKGKVHISDIRKMISWYNILQQANMLNFEETKAEKEGENKVEVKTENTPKPQYQQQKQSKTHTKAPTIHKQTVRKTGTA